MGSNMKKGLAALISAVLASYLLGAAYLEAVYGKKLESMEGGLLAYEARERELALQRDSLAAETTSLKNQVRIVKDAIVSLEGTTPRNATRSPALPNEPPAYGTPRTEPAQEQLRTIPQPKAPTTTISRPKAVTRAS